MIERRENKAREELFLIYKEGSGAKPGQMPGLHLMKQIIRYIQQLF